MPENDNVSNVKLELGQGHDLGVTVVPFVKILGGVRVTQDGNAGGKGFYASSESGEVHQKILEEPEIFEEKEVSDKIAYLENASMQNVLLFQTDLSPSGNAVAVYDSCTKGICTCEYVLGGDKTQLKPCRFVYILSLCTQEGRETFTPLFLRCL